MKSTTIFRSEGARPKSRCSRGARRGSSGLRAMAGGPVRLAGLALVLHLLGPAPALGQQAPGQQERSRLGDGDETRATVADGESALRVVTVAAGYVARPIALENDGEVLASAAEGEVPERSLSTFDEIYLPLAFDGRPTAPGDSVLVYADGGELHHSRTGASLGRIVYPTGIAVVTSLGADVASAVLARSFAPVVVRQRVQYLGARAGAVPVGEREGGEGLVVGFRDEAAIVEPYAVIYLDLLPGTGLRAGSKVMLVRSQAVKGRQLPEVEIGTARVLDVGESVATAIVLDLARSDLERGDRYVVLGTGS